MYLVKIGTFQSLAHTFASLQYQKICAKVIVSEVLYVYFANDTNCLKEKCKMLKSLFLEININ